MKSLKDFVDKEYWNDGYVTGKSEQLYKTIDLIKEMKIPEFIKEEIIKLLNEDFYE